VSADHFNLSQPFSQLGSGTVYQGTWNRTDVAIKVLQNVAGITPSLVVSIASFSIGLTNCPMCSCCDKKLMCVPSLNCISGCTDFISDLADSAPPECPSVSGCQYFGQHTIPCDAIH
jgi:hypothetical protein